VTEERGREGQRALGWAEAERGSWASCCAGPKGTAGGGEGVGPSGQKDGEGRGFFPFSFVCFLFVYFFYFQVFSKQFQINSKKYFDFAQKHNTMKINASKGLHKQVAKSYNKF